MTRHGPILVFVEDPGAANFLADLPRELQRRGLPALLVADGAARDYLDARGVRSEGIPSDAGGWVRKVRPRAVVVGTSENLDSTAFTLVDACRQEGIPSVGAVDALPNAAHRFRGRTNDPLAHAPDQLLVPDAATERAFAALGYPPGRIRVCGHPQYDAVRAARQVLDGIGRTVLRSQHYSSAPADRPVLLFLAEVSTGLTPRAYERSPAYTLHGRGGSDRRTDIVLEELLEAVGGLRPRPWLAVRMHPKNTPADFRAYRAEVDQMLAGGPGLGSVHAADAVVGMTSMLLLEAALLGRPTLAVVPREEERGWLPTLAMGITPCATTRDALRATLPGLLAGSGGDAADALPSGGLARAADALLAAVGIPARPEAGAPRS